jgi:endonuclease-3
MSSKTDSSGNKPTSEKVKSIYERLIETYGRPERHDPSRPVDSLIGAILSQNTNDANRDRAYNRLRNRFPTWEEVRDAPVDEIVEAIRPAGLANQKAPRIKKVLERITEERGELSLDFLDDMPIDEAREWLTSLHGVGPKTAAIVLLFSLGRPAFPVDTHVHRVSKRLGLIGDKVNAEKAHQLLEDALPTEWYYPFHLDLVQHGRQVCHSRNPECEVCTLSDLCDYYQREYNDA